ncbi:MAG: oligoendopeptidase F [Firmicutes bacterium]|nr:oligoendopeptidase F [Bacillota bacterium]
MKRSEIDKKYTWNLETLFENEKAWEVEHDAVKVLIQEMLAFKGKFSQRDELLKALKKNDEISQRLIKVFIYTFLKKDLDGRDGNSVSLFSRANTLYVEYATAVSFMTPELASLSEETLTAHMNDKEFFDYSYVLEGVIRSKKYILSEREERILAMAGKTFNAFSELHHNIEDLDLPLPKINVNGKKEQLSHGKFGLWMSSDDRKLRKDSYNGMYGAIRSLINTLATNYSSSVNKDNLLAKVRGYESAIEDALHSRHVPTGVYNKLVEKASGGLDAVHDYVALRKKLLGYDTLYMYDLYVPMFEKTEIKLPYDKAYDLMLEGLKPMGEEYQKLLIKARDFRWIDVFETEGKRSGAYVTGQFGLNPFVLLNYQENTNNIFTLAHEMGHALHSYYSNEKQPFAKASYEIFVAEVASTVNEVLLLKHLLKVTKDVKIKKYLLSYYLDMFRTTLFRQTMFAEFESEAHRMEAEGQALTVDSLSEVYLNLNKKYYGESVVHDENIAIEWARIPHFYNAFYVYQYSTGIISAVNIVRDILTKGEPAVKNYIENFLSAGGSKSPYEILKDAGCDLMTDAPFDAAFAEFRETLEELKKL